MKEIFVPYVLTYLYVPGIKGKLIIEHVEMSLLNRTYRYVLLWVFLSMFSFEVSYNGSLRGT